MKIWGAIRFLLVFLGLLALYLFAAVTGAGKGVYGAEFEGPRCETLTTYGRIEGVAIDYKKHRLIVDWRQILEDRSSIVMLKFSTLEINIHSFLKNRDSVTQLTIITPWCHQSNWTYRLVGPPELFM